jgi:hypothetical protein
MSNETGPTPAGGASDAPAPLARVLFGWTRVPGIALSLLAGLGILGAGLVAAEFMRPRMGLQLPYESQPGFYAAFGMGAVVAVALAGALIRWLVEREHPYTDETLDSPPKGDGSA